jgi:hypothetical protein
MVLTEEGALIISFYYLNTLMKMKEVIAMPSAAAKCHPFDRHNCFLTFKLLLVLKTCLLYLSRS